MKLTANTSPVEISGAVSAPSTFHIAASKEAFQILSSGLYTNKIRAIIRELSCNAYDAHVAAGRVEEPFKIHLPTVYEPYFSVKDYGTGLEFKPQGCEHCAGTGQVTDTGQATVCKTCDGSGDYDAARELYCTYFSSNKSQSNMFVGALGLGSKSPFCYTEGFSITNRFDGITRIYSCYLDSTGLPAVLLQEKRETPQARNGVEVSFPVKQNDIWEFHNQAQYVLEFFFPRPKINITDLRINEESYELKTEFWGLRHDSGDPRAIQGMVQYAIGSIDESRITESQARMLEQPLDLFFPIGELSVAASRESLSNTEQTITNILAMIDRVKTDLVEMMQAEVAKCNSAWDARFALLKFAGIKGLSPIIEGLLQQGAFADSGVGLDDPITLSGNDRLNFELNHLDYIDLSINKFTHTYSTYARVTRWLDPLPTGDLQGYSRKYFKFKFEHVTDKTVFVINDVGRGVQKYVDALVQTGRSIYNEAYLLGRANKKVTKETAIEQANKLIKTLGGPPVLLVSDLKANWVETHKANKPVGPAREMFTLDENYVPSEGALGWINAWEAIDPKSVDPAVTKYYVPLKSLAPQSDSFLTCRHLVSYARAVRKSKLWAMSAGDAVYGVPFWNVSQLDSTWVELTSYVMAELSRQWSLGVQLSAFGSDGFSTHINPIFRRVSKLRTFPDDHPMQWFSDQFVLTSSYKSDSDLSNLVVRAQARGLCPKLPVIDLNDEWTKLIDLYPLLRCCNGNVEDYSILEYINLMDEKRARQQEREETVATFASIVEYDNAVSPLEAEKEELSYAN